MKIDLLIIATTAKEEFDRLMAKENRTQEEEDLLDGLSRLVKPGMFTGTVGSEGDKK